jgi:hypothetical protein
MTATPSTASRWRPRPHTEDKITFVQEHIFPIQVSGKVLSIVSAKAYLNRL